MERVTEAYSKDDVMSMMEPLLAEWFSDRFSELTEPQSFAIPIIHRRENVLVSSPTGSGKTLTAFLSIINELLRYAKDGKLEDRVYAVYVSPLKALANDINRNLREPLSEVKALAERKGVPFPEIRVGVRSGDTSQAERQKMLRKPPHIFITTPESLAMVLAAPKFKEKFSKVEWAIVDEVHEICDSKRGVFLSLTLERLQAFCARRFTRIGLSATLAPIEEIAAFLVGCEDGRQRDVKVVEVRERKNLDLKVLCPTDDMTSLPYEIVNSKMYDMLGDMVREHTTTLVFTNTRSGTESVVYKLKERGLDSIEAHHGSLSKETRLGVEERLKRSELKCVVSSTSLELGIDIGSIDLVCQIGSPKSVAKGLQRIGRSGHGYRQTSKGRMIVFDNDDLVECAVLCRAAHRNKIDRVSIPQNCLDVLAQSIVGMSIESRWKVDDALRLVRGSYCYRDLPAETFEGVLRYLGSKDAFEGVYSKIWYDEEERVFGRKRGARMIYFLNLGTIPEEANYKVYAERGALMGDLSEKFVERLSPRDIFVLGGRAYEFVRSRGMSVYAKSASGKKPTVPSWTGEMLPRSFDLSMEVAKFRGEIAARMKDEERKTLEWLVDDFGIDHGSARSILSYFQEQRTACGEIPTDKRLVIEGYVDMTGNRNIIFHFPFGRRVNDALSRAYAFQITQQLGCSVSVSVTDDAFMISVPRNIELKGVEKMISSSNLESLLRRAIKDSEIFKQRFRHTAARSFMILRNYKGREVSVNRQQIRSSYLLDALRSLERVPVIEETYREILEDVMDLRNARLVLKMIESGDMGVASVDFSSVPSPFAHNVVLAGISDIVLMEDRSSLLKELHRKILSKVMAGELSEFEFEEQEVSAYFRNKIGRIDGKKDILRILKIVGPMRMFKERVRSIYPYASQDRKVVDGWIEELLSEGRISSVFSDDLYFVRSEDLQTYATLFRKERRLGDLDKNILDLLDSEKSHSELAEVLSISVDRVSKSLRNLESASLAARVAHRNGHWYFKARSIEERDRKAALEKAICKYLEGFAPSTSDEISFVLGQSDSEVNGAIRALVNEGLLIEGKFLVSEHEQYMLRKDYLRLKSQDPEVYDMRTVEMYRMSKTQGPFASIEDCVRFFGSVGDPLDVFYRVSGFSMDDWEGLRRNGKILLGRFLRGRVRYVLADDAPMYVSVYRTGSPVGVDRRVLDFIRQNDALGILELHQMTGMPKEQLKSSLDWLDRNLHLVRRFEHREEWSRENTYEPYDAPEYEGNARGKMVQRFIMAFGPVPMFAMTAYTGLPPDEVREILAQLDIVEISVGEGGIHMFIMADEIERLQSLPEHQRKMRVLSLFDPEVQPLRSEIASRYGDRLVYPIMSDGILVGAVEKWNMSGCIEVRALDLEDPSLLPDSLAALDELMTFYKMLGYDVLRIKEILGKGVDEIDGALESKLIRSGYHRIGSALIKGKFVPNTYRQEDLLRYVLWRQAVPADRNFENILEGVRKTGGFRSDAAAHLRCKVKVPLKKLFEQGTLVRVQAIPEYLTYTTIENASLYRKAKSVPMNEDMNSLIRILEDRRSISRNELYTLSPVGHVRTHRALRDLYMGAAVYFDSSKNVHLVPESSMTTREARIELFRLLFRNYGIFSAEEIVRFIKFRIPMKEAREILADLEAEGFLVKGFFLENDETLRWMHKEDLDRVGTDFDDGFVLTTDDNLHSYLLPLIRERFGYSSAIFRGSEMIGAFKGRSRGKDLFITEFVGDREARIALKQHMKAMGLTLRKIGEQTIPDWEVQEFYEKTHPGET